MIKTGDWSIADLIKYLVAVQSTLSADEIERLCITPAFPKENKEVVASGDIAKVARFKAGDLYEPLDVFRDLGLPVLDWGTKTKWRPSSEEGSPCIQKRLFLALICHFSAKFLFRLGLRRFPPLEAIVQLAGGPDARIRGLALKYFLDNHATRYTDYNSSTFSQIAFIPAVKNKSEYLAKPGEVSYTVSIVKDFFLDECRYSHRQPGRYLDCLLSTPV